MTAEEARQLASIAAVAEEADRVLDKLFTTVDELKALLARASSAVPAPGAARETAKAVPVAESTPPPESKPPMTSLPPGPGQPAAPQPNGALETAQALQHAIEGLRDNLAKAIGRLGSAEKGIRRSKRLILGLIVSLILDLALTIGVTVATVQSHTASVRAAATAEQLRASQINACEIGNQLRAKQILPWQKLISLSSPAPGTTPAQVRQQRKLLAQFLAYVRSVYPQLSCQKLYAR